MAHCVVANPGHQPQKGCELVANYSWKLTVACFCQCFRM